MSHEKMWVIMPIISKEETFLHLLWCLLTCGIHNEKAIFCDITNSGGSFIQCGGLNLLAGMRAWTESYIDSLLRF